MQTPTWSTRKMMHIFTMENVQRTATKYLLPLKHMTYEEILKKFNLPTL